MIFFFGTRANRIGHRKRLNNTECSYCQNPNTFETTTFGRYAHFFWVPLFPIGKVTVAECNHCKKTYSKDEFTPDMLRSLERVEEVNPSKTPIWHGCGCLLIIGLILFSFISAGIGYLFNKDEINNYDNEYNNDYRTEYLEADKARVTSDMTFEQDSIAFMVKECITFSIDGINTEAIEYVSSVNADKLLLLLKVGDMKQIKKSSRKELMFAVEECLDNLEHETINKRYIGIDGNWNMLLVSSPDGRDLGGKFADEDLLLSFYDEEQEELIINSNGEDEVFKETVIESTEAVQEVEKEIIRNKD